MSKQIKDKEIQDELVQPFFFPSYEEHTGHNGIPQRDYDPGQCLTVSAEVLERKVRRWREREQKKLKHKKN